MAKAFGIISPAGTHINVAGLQEHRPVGSFSFLGRYRVVDFPISNMSNSGIDRIQVYTRNNPRSLAEHLGTGRHYNINSKRGKLQLLFAKDHTENVVYNTDIAAYAENIEIIARMHQEYVVIAPDYMVYTQNYETLLEDHVASGADITLLYHTVDNAKEAFLNCDILNLNKQKEVESIEKNRGSAKNRSIFMDTYVMKKDLLVALVKKARKLSSMYTLAQIVNLSLGEMDVRGVAHRGYFASLADFRSYYESNMNLIDYKAAKDLFTDGWTIYTRTNDSCPTQYFEGAEVNGSVISNGCHIEGTVENSIIGRGCTVKKGAVVKNSILLANVTIGEGVHVENQVVDKWAQIVHAKEVIGSADQPGYVRRDDTL